MLNLGPLAFAQPWVLLALVALPALWWLLRIMPPAPKKISFPAVRFLLGLKPAEETPARMPIWLLLLRLAVAVLAILALAQPIMNPERALVGDGPVLIVMEDGWAAAPNWVQRQEAALEVVRAAERQNRDVALVLTAPDAQTSGASDIFFGPATSAEERVLGLEPRPWAGDRTLLAARLSAAELPRPLETVWFSEGLEGGPLPEILDDLSGRGEVTLYRPGPQEQPLLALPPVTEGLEITLGPERLEAGPAREITLHGVGEDGRIVFQEPLTIQDGETLGELTVTLPVELRNRLARLEIEGQPNVGATYLLDERSRRRPIGLVSTGPLEEAQPLLSELYYIERALEPTAEIFKGDLSELLEREGLAVLVLPDLGALPEVEVLRLTKWVENGGLLLRFAGPRLAESNDDLLPVNLRLGGRTLGGALTWDEPARLAPFPENSPFFGLELPEDVTIARQVLAEPSLDMAERTWARLTDGTPLVTAAPRGEGRVVLVHTTANTDWSNLALSGLYVQMMERVVAASQGIGQRRIGDRALPPLRTMDGFGRLGEPAPTVLALAQQDVDSGDVSASHPPGYYGTEAGFYAHNLIDGDLIFSPLGRLPLDIKERAYSLGEEQPLAPWLYLAALLLVLADSVISLFLRGLMPAGLRRKRATAAGLAIMMALALSFGPGAARAQDATTDAAPVSDAKAIAATSDVHLAYVITGVPSVDDITRSGLEGLSRVVSGRTAAEPAAPVGVRLGRDEAAFYPLLYWSITPEQRDLDAAAIDALNTYMQNGGTLFIDLREANSGSTVFGQATRGTMALRRLTEGVNIPPLVPVDPEHVMTKAFYLLQDFPGRFEGGTLWVEDTEETRNDGVASLIVGSNDWVGAWAINELGRPLQVVVPGGERQRELSFRVGVNLVMYALTGNYKADQVHVPFILERLGQ